MMLVVIVVTALYTKCCYYFDQRLRSFSVTIHATLHGKKINQILLLLLVCLNVHLNQFSKSIYLPILNHYKHLSS